MKRLLSFFALGVTVVIAIAATVKISDLPLSTSPSTNTFIEIADMNAVTKSAKFQFNGVTKQAITNALAAPNDTNQFLNGAGGWGTSLNLSGTLGARGKVALGNAADFSPAQGTIGKQTDLSLLLQDFNTNTSWVSVYGVTTANPTNTLAALTIYGFEFDINTDPTNTINYSYLIGTWGGAFHYGPGNVTGLYGATINAQNAGNGFISEMNGLRIAAENEADGNIGSNYGINVKYFGGNGFTGTIDNNYGIYVGPGESYSPVTNNFGIYIDDQSGVGSGSNYNLYSKGASSKNFFEGSISAGSTNAWKMGAVKSCSGLTMIVTNYIEVVINGVTNAIPLGTVTP